MHYSKKGNLAIGRDADLAVIDINKEKEVTLDNLYTAQDFSPELGMKLKGWAEYTILRGNGIFENGEVTGKPGYGEYIKRPVSSIMGKNENIYNFSKQYFVIE